MTPGSRKGFLDILSAAINDIIKHGFDSVHRVEDWTRRLVSAAEISIGDPRIRAEMLRDALTIIYQRLVDKGGIVRHHQGIERFTIQRVKPKLRAELDRRIAASANLIKLNREEAISDIRRRFIGWATSVPEGGIDVARRREVKDQVKKSLYQLPFHERRVVIDQSHKLINSLDAVIAEDQDAIAARWHSKFRSPGYNARIVHKHRDQDGLIFLRRDSWAHKAGLVKPSDAGFTDQIEQPGQLVFCQCRFVYLYSLRQLPAEMITEKGRQEQAKIRAARVA
jgi:hypothetical protein